VNVSPPGCGDFVLEPGEQCDDGNNIDGDGCSATCLFEKNFINETEPNDTLATANALGSADGFIAAIGFPGDLDHFSFVITPGEAAVQIKITDGLGGCPVGFDSKITLFDSLGTQIATDDDGLGVGQCSAITPQKYSVVGALTPGTYTVKVQHKNTLSTVA